MNNSPRFSSTWMRTHQGVFCLGIQPKVSEALQHALLLQVCLRFSYCGQSSIVLTFFHDALHLSPRDLVDLLLRQNQVGRQDEPLTPWQSLPDHPAKRYLSYYSNSG